MGALKWKSKLVTYSPSGRKRENPLRLNMVMPDGQIDQVPRKLYGDAGSMSKVCISFPSVCCLAITDAQFLLHSDCQADKESRF